MAEKLKDFEIKFDEKNPNSILIYKDGRLYNMLYSPHIKNGIDVVNFGKDLEAKYNYNFDGFVIITTNYKKKLYYKGKLIAKN